MARDFHKSKERIARKVDVILHCHFFSDWFRGLGLLIIIKHGDGFMSLYAHNETLKKETGDIVNPDELIATILKFWGSKKQESISKSG